MPKLYRCRTSLGEVASLFDAHPPVQADWSAELWPGRTGLIVREERGRRRIEAMRWGAMVPTGVAEFPRENRTALWFRELWPAHPRLLVPEARCLIIVEDFALPDGPTGARTRTWYGLEDRPLFAWAGLWSVSGGVSAYCGFLVAGASPLSSKHNMPAIVSPENQEAWLGGDLVIASRIARQSRPQTTMYREATEQPWGADRMP